MMQLKKRCAEIKKLVVKQFGSELKKPEEPRFSFINELSTVNSKIITVKEEPNEPLGIIYSYFAPFGDPLLQPELDPIPEGLLQRLREVGANGVWFHVELNQLAASKTFPEFGKGHEIRLQNLRKMVQKAKKHGIKIYLYINEPHGMPASFFEGRENIRGVHWTIFGMDLYAMCTSVPEVRQWITDSLEYVFKEVPDLGGILNISASEMITNCWFEYHPEGCPRCSKRQGHEVVSEVVHSIADGVHKGNPNAKVIIWDWGWLDPWVEPIIQTLPDYVYYMTVSEWDKAIVRGGIHSRVQEYSLSCVGPSERSIKRWNMARQKGLKTMAKVQISTTWELSSLPYLPVMNLVAEHCENLAKQNVDDLMLSWSLGGYPSPNLKLAKLLSARPMPSVKESLNKVATEYYGSATAPDVVDAWAKFSEAFVEYPFSGQVLIYRCPMQVGPSNILFPEPTGKKSTMVGFPYDDIEGWRDMYPLEVLISQFEKMAAGWQGGLESFKKALDKQMTSEQKENVIKDYQIAEAAYYYFTTCSNQIKFTMARNKLLAGTSGSEEREALLRLIKSVALEEKAIAKRFFVLARQDSRFGWEAGNHYCYLPYDFVEKVINCDYILNDWLPKQVDLNKLN